MVEIVASEVRGGCEAFILTKEASLWSELGIAPKEGVCYFARRDGVSYLLCLLDESRGIDGVRCAAGSIVFEAERLKLERFNLHLPGAFGLEEETEAASEGVLLAGYSYARFKKEKPVDIKVHIVNCHSDALERGRSLAETANYVRDLVNTPGNLFVPESFVEAAAEFEKIDGVDIRVYRGEELAENGFIGTYTVGKGSTNPPVFVHLSYKPENATFSFVAVGKGITFDSGGLSVKPQNFMETMKMDKAGACAVLGLFRYVVERQIPVALHVLIPSAENMPDGGAYRPDDIIKFPNGVSVEIHSTDAEGRLLLADALCYARGLNPDVVVDVATLTGACVVALGRYTSGLFCEDEELRSLIVEASQRTGEKVWPMPLDRDLEDELKTEHADVRNNAKGRYGGAITAALFLKRFVDYPCRWAHLDIAGPAYLESKWKYYRAGATGQPVRTLALLLERLAHRSQR